MNTESKFYSSEQLPKIEKAIGDYEMDNLLSGVGNHANKLILLASMKPGTIYGKTGRDSAFNLLRDAQRDASTKGWVPEYSTPYNYLVNSLSPIGMVAKEFINKDEGKIGYELTAKGENVGIPLAGILMDFASRHNLALSQLFGDTTSKNPDARAGGIRWRLFQGLATQQPDIPISITGLAQSVEESIQRTTTNLSELSEIGLIHYESGTKRPAQTYKVDLDALQTHALKMRGKSLEVAEYILTAGIDACTVASLAEGLTGAHPVENTPIFRSNLKSILKNLEKIGITERTVENSGDAKVMVSTKQQDILQELVQLIDDLQNGVVSTYNKGRELAQSIKNNPDLVASLLAHEKAVSVHYHGQENAKKRGARIIEILNRSGSPLTYEQIQSELIVMGDIVSKQGIARILKNRSDVSVDSGKSSGREASVSIK